MSRFHILTSGHENPSPIRLRPITFGDVVAALTEGWADFLQKPSHYGFVVLLYPVIGLALFFWVSRGNAMQLIYPLISGFALLGPVAAIGLYEISRRLERHEEASWRHAFAVLHSPALPAILAVGLALLLWFILWVYVAGLIYALTFDGQAHEDLRSLIRDVLSTPEGRTLMVIGNLVGFLFAVVTLCTTVVTFPLLLDRDVGAITAVKTSIRAVWQNPAALLGWGLVIAVLLGLGALPGLAGLIIVLPVLGHATWHIYRKLVVGSGPPASRGTPPVRDR
ncbi:DUF2189 domain-containing protein [Sulfitobacter aestuarii]|uniref:DUF2189 domain-containing protein n=1 Tax=Sulfitobacter aestuarii TaxID=2161676 RepID=A0ABW5U764_9RHOB